MRSPGSRVMMRLTYAMMSGMPKIMSAARPASMQPELSRSICAAFTVAIFSSCRGSIISPSIAPDAFQM